MKTALITLAIIGGGASGAAADTTPARENPGAIIDRAQQDLDRRIREAEIASRTSRPGWTSCAKTRSTGAASPPTSRNGQ